MKHIKINLAPKKAVPTNVVTGFLGVGKTSAIRHLLSLKPAGERWAVLINEFGKVGIDRQLLDSIYHDQTEIEIREVAGGCMCCAAGLPMQVALNQLLRLHSPDRLLIEPSGLGHPEEVIASLSGPNYRGLLDLRATLTMLDARHFQDSRYTEHPIFLQQLHIADVLVANKSDLSAADDRQKLQQSLLRLDLEQLPLYHTEQAQIEPAWLAPAAKFNQADWPATPETFWLTETKRELPAKGYLRETQDQDGWFSCGWRIHGAWQFDAACFVAWCRHLPVNRLKAVVNTVRGSLLINRVDAQLTEEWSRHAVDESRVELISEHASAPAHWEQQLLDCRASVATHYS